MHPSGQKVIDTSYMRSYASRPAGAQQVTMNMGVSPNKVQQQHSPMQPSRPLQISPMGQSRLPAQPFPQQSMSPVNRINNSSTKRFPVSPISSSRPQLATQQVQQQSSHSLAQPVSPVNRSVSPVPRPSTLGQLQQQQQQFQKSAYSTVPKPTLSRANIQQVGLDVSHKSSFLDQQIYEQFKDKKIDFQIFANNLIQKLLEFHEKLIPLSKNKYFDVTTLNQYDVVIDDLNQELSIKNQTILDNLEKIRDLEQRYKKENQQLKQALSTNKQLQMVSNEEQNQRSIPHGQEQERAFQKEIQCLQGFLEIKLITFLEQLFVDYHRIIVESQSMNQKYEVEKQHHLKQLYELQQGRVSNVSQYEDEIKLLTDTLAQRDVLIYQKQVEINRLQNTQPQVVHQVDNEEIIRLEQTIASQKEIIDSLQEQLIRKPQEVEVEVKVEDHSRINQLENELDMLRHKLSEKENYFIIEGNNYQKTIRDQEKNLRVLEEKYQELQDLYNKKEAENEENKKLVGELRVEIEEYIEEITGLESQLNVNDDSKWQAKISLLEQEAEDLRLKLRDSQTDVRQYQEENENVSKIIDQKSNQIYQLQQQINDLESEHNNTKMQLVDARKTSQDIQQINVNTKKDLIKTRADLEEYEEQYRSLETKLRKKEREMEEMRSDMETMNTSRRNDNDETQHLQKINDLTNRLNRAENENQLKEDKLQKQSREINKMQFDLDQQKDYIENLEKQNKRQRSELESKMDQLDNTKKQYEQAQDIHNSQRKSIVRKSLLKADLLNFASNN